MARSSRHTPLLIIALVLAAALLFAVPAAFANTLKLVQELPTGQTPKSIAQGDINGDGLADLAVGNFNSSSITIYYQQPTGGFSTDDSETLRLLFPTNANPCSVGIGDVDGDGLADVVASGARYQLIYLFRQIAPGVFFEPTSLDTHDLYPIHPAYAWHALGWDAPGFLRFGFYPLGNGHQIQVVNLDPWRSDTAEIVASAMWVLDGDPDNDKGGVYIAEWAAGQDTSGSPVTTRLRNYFDHSFVPTEALSHYAAAVGTEWGPWNPQAVAAGDFNNDGYLDVFLGGYYGTGNFGAGPSIISAGMGLFADRAFDMPIMANPVKAAAGDLNDDGLTDLALTGRLGTGEWAVALQDDYGRLGASPPETFGQDTTADPSGVVIGDVNDDGLADLILANAHFDETTGTIGIVPQMSWPNRQRRAPLSFERRFAAGRYPQEVAVADFDTADDISTAGHPMNEVAVVNANSNTVMIYDQVPPDPPDIVIEGGSSAPVKRISSRAAERSILWLSDTSPVIRFAEPSPSDLNVMKGYYWLLDTNGSTEPTPGIVPPTTPWTFVNTSTPVMLRNLTSGVYYLHVVSIDMNDNLGTTVGHYQINIDVTPPVCGTPSDGYAGTWSEADVRNVTWLAATDTQSGPRDYIYSVDGGAETITTELSVLVSGLTDGEHIFSLKARDNANPPNVSSTRTLVMRVDKGLPTCSLTSPAASALVARDFRAVATAADAAGIAKVEFWLNGVLKATDTAAPYSQIVSTAGLSSGSYTLVARAYDMFGHTKEDARAIKLDTVPPKMVNVSLAPNPFFPIKRDGYKDNLYIRFWLSENSKIKLYVTNRTGSVAGYRYHNLTKGSRTLIWNGTLISKSGSTFKVPVGTYYVRLTAWDAAGNAASTRAYSVRVQRYILVVLSGSRVKLVEH